MDYVQKCCSPLQENLLVQRGLDIQMRAKYARTYIKWGTLNVVLLAILLFDINNKCPYAHSNWYLLEYVATAIVGLSMVACFVKYFLYIFHTEPVQGTKAQKNLLNFEENDSSFVTEPPMGAAQKRECDLNTTPAAQAVNTTILSWHSSFNGPMSANWSFSRTTPPRQSLSPQQQQQQQQQQQGLPHMLNASWNSSMANNSTLNGSHLSNNTSFASPYNKYKRDDLIADEQSLREYLREVAKREYSLNETADMSHNTMHVSSVNSFWNYCNTAANLLKSSLYQLAPSTTPTTPNKQSDEGGFNIIDSNSEVIKRISSEKLSRYVANLRMWMASTILQRLVKEFEHINESFMNRGILDMQLGNIGLERLKKTVENQQFVNQYMPKLPLIVPFLEMSSNQEYLVQRIKDLAKGSCIADYRWNTGSSYHGLKWDEHLPTDSAILFHLFCVYLDSQLMPLPQGGGRPFYNRYVVVGEEKRSAKDTIAAVQNKAHCAIVCTNPMKPKFNFISDKEIHNCAYDRNNLFYVIIQFLLYMRTHNESALEGVNLGKSGINIMCVVED